MKSEEIIAASENLSFAPCSRQGRMIGRGQNNFVWHPPRFFFFFFLSVLWGHWLTEINVHGSIAECIFAEEGRSYYFVFGAA